MPAPIIEDEGMACVQPAGSEDQCAACARPARTTTNKIIPAMYVTFLRLGGEPVWECIHRVHVSNVAPAGDAEKTAMCGGVDDTTPLNRVGAA
jgi:hypothetical protein